MQCPKCGAEIRESSKFCPNCGEKIVPAVDVTATTATTTANTVQDPMAQWQDELRQEDTAQQQDVAWQQDVAQPVAPEKKGLAIASLVVGILALLGALTSAWTIVLGVICLIVAIVGLILGIMGVKKKMGGMAVAGIVLSALALFVSIIAMGVTGALVAGSMDNPSELSKSLSAISSNESQADEDEADEPETGKDSEEAKEPEESGSEAEAEEDYGKYVSVQKKYTLTNSYATTHVLIVKNNSNVTLEISGDSTALNKSGGMLGASSATQYAVGPGCTTFLYEYFSGVKKPKKIKTEITAEVESYASSVLQDLTVKGSKKGDHVTAKVTNKGKTKAKYVEGLCVFKKGNKVVYMAENYFGTNGEIKAGKSKTEQFNSYGVKSNKYEIYLSAQGEE